MICPKCGKEIRDGAKFCQSCGAPVSAGQGFGGQGGANPDSWNRGYASPESPVPGNEHRASTVRKRPAPEPVKQGADTGKKKSSKKTLLIVLVIVAAVLLVCVIGCAAAYLLLGNQNHQGSDAAAESVQIEKGTALTEEEASQIYLDDLSDEDWDTFEVSCSSFSQIVGEYTTEDGYIEKSDASAILQAVTDYADELYEGGTLTYYLVEDEELYMEFASGLSAFYTPAIEGYAAGGKASGVCVLTFDPASRSGVQTSAQEVGEQVQTNLNPRDDWQYSGIPVEVTSETDGDVTVSSLMSLDSANVFLWQGHGGTAGEKPCLITGTPATKDALEAEGLTADPQKSLSAAEVTAAISAGSADAGAEQEALWAITPKFVTERIELDQGLVYLSACRSGRSDKLAQAFLDSGAEAVFVNVSGTVRMDYTCTMMRYILDYLSGGADGVFHTAEEALTLANERYAELFEESGGVTLGDGEDAVHYDTLEDYIADAQDGTHVEYRGEGDYTLVSGIRGTIQFDDTVTDEDLAEILPTLSVLVTDGDGAAKEFSAEESEFCINQMEAGDYTLALYASGKKIGGDVSFTVQDHRCTSVSIPCEKRITLTGTVLNESGSPLEGVTVTAWMSSDSAFWSDETQTGADGTYTLTVLGEHLYTLSFLLSGYETLETEAEVTKEMYDDSHVGTVYSLEDAVLQTGEIQVLLHQEEGPNQVRHVSNGVETLLADTDLYRWTILIPGNEQAQQSIQDVLNEKAEEDLNDAEDMALSTLDEDPDDFLYDSGPSYYSSVLDQVFTSGSALSLQWYSEQYLAGAVHGMYSNEEYTFDLSDGRILTVGDIVQDTSALNTLVDLFAKQLNDPDLMLDDTPEHIVSAAIGDGTAKQGWSLQEDGMHLTFDPSEVAPYAWGTVDVSVPYSQLKEVLKGEYCPTSSEGSGQAKVSISNTSSAALSEYRQTFGESSAEQCLTTTGTVRALKVTDPSAGVLVWYANRLDAGDLIYLEGEASVVGQYSLSYD